MNMYCALAKGKPVPINVLGDVCAFATLASEGADAVNPSQGCTARALALSVMNDIGAFVSDISKVKEGQLATPLLLSTLDLLYWACEENRYFYH
jgi:hypothetical protein